MVANFVEVRLAREGHDRPVGINYLEKIPIPHLPSLYGALLAGVHYVLMGAGIPFRVPGALDRLAGHEAATYPLSLAGHATTPCGVVRSARSSSASLPLSSVPPFLPSSRQRSPRRSCAPTASSTASSSKARPPAAQRAAAWQDAAERDRRTRLRRARRARSAKFRGLGLPFWLAGGYAQPRSPRGGPRRGRSGHPVGTAFAFCDDSGLRPDYNAALLAEIRDGTPRADRSARVAHRLPVQGRAVAGTMSEAAVYETRPRLRPGYLREAYRPETDRRLRCPAEPVAATSPRAGPPIPSAASASATR